MANQPDIIPMAWAENNSTASSIPETTSESGKASWDQGFPVETSLPLSQGGIPPKYGDFNGILKILSQFAVFAQAGGQYAWSNQLDYGVGSIVLGTDGNLYRAAQASGISTAAVNPVGDTSGKWARIVSKGDIDALEANVVKKNGDQTINGSLNLTKGNPYLSFIETDIEKGTPQASGGTSYQGFHFDDKNSTILAQLTYNYGQNKDSYLSITVNKANTSSDSDSMGCYVGYPASSGNPFFRPGGNGQVVLGLSSNRWKEVWCTQSSLNSSSDERVKQQVASVPDEVLDAWGEIEWIQFKYNDAVAEKGAEQARLHNGLIAQRVDEAFAAHGLDVSKYGFFLYDAWNAIQEEKDDKGQVVVPAREAGDAYGLRYTEALCMEAAYQRRRADRAEARISALERRLAEMEAVIASLIAPVGNETYAEEAEAEE